MPQNVPQKSLDFQSWAYATSGSADPQVVNSNQELILNSGEVCEEQTESLAWARKCVTVLQKKRPSVPTSEGRINNHQHQEDKT